MPFARPFPGRTTDIVFPLTKVTYLLYDTRRSSIFNTRSPPNNRPNTSAKKMSPHGIQTIILLRTGRIWYEQESQKFTFTQRGENMITEFGHDKVKYGGNISGNRMAVLPGKSRREFRSKQSFRKCASSLSWKGRTWTAVKANRWWDTCQGDSFLTPTCKNLAANKYYLSLLLQRIILPPIYSWRNSGLPEMLFRLWSEPSDDKDSLR